MADDNKALFDFDDIFSKTDVFDKLDKNIDDLEKRLVKFAKTLDKAFAKINPNDEGKVDKAVKQTKDLIQVQDQLEKQKKASIKTRKKLADLTNKELQQREKEKKAQRERVQTAKQTIILNNKSAGQIEKLRANLSLVTLQWKKLTEEEIKNNKVLDKLGTTAKDVIKAKLRLTNQLKKLEEATGDNRRSVGFYEKSLKLLRRTLLRVFVGRTIIDGIARLGSALVDIVQQGADTNENFAALIKTFSRAKRFLIGLATTFLEFISGPLTSLVNTFLFVADAIGKASGEGTILGFIFGGIGKIFTGVIKIITTLPAIFGGIVAAARDFGTTTVNIFRRMGLQLQIIFQEIDKFNPFSDKTTQQIEANIRRIAAAQRALAAESIGVQAAFRKGFDDVIKAQEEFNNRQEDGLVTTEDTEAIAAARTKRIEEQNRLIEKQKSLLIQIQISEKERLSAIDQLNKALIDAEISNIEDRQTMLFALEEERFKVEQAQRENNFNILKLQIEQQEISLLALFKEGSEEVIAFRKQADKDLKALRNSTNLLEIEQEKTHQNNLLNIKKDFAFKTAELETIDLQKDALSEQADLINQEVALVEDGNQRKKDSSEQLLKDTQAIAKKVGEAIVETFKKQAEVANSLVKSQSEAVETQRKRAEAGLQNTLKFEQETLAQREADRIRAQKKAENTAKILALINMVSAAAASGDANAVGTALVQFALLETLVGALEGLYDGTEDTGTVRNPLDSKGGMLKILHPHERVMSAKHNAPLLALGMSNDEVRENALLGHMMKDRQLLNANHYRQQFNDFEKATHRTDTVVNNSRLEAEMRQVVLAIKNKPVQQDDLVKVTKTAVIISRRVTTNMMTRKEKIKHYL